MICDYRSDCREDCTFKDEGQTTIGFKSTVTNRNAPMQMIAEI